MGEESASLAAEAPVNEAIFRIAGCLVEMAVADRRRFDRPVLIWRC